MTASFSAEMLKLRKRPATWALGGILAAIVAFFGYVFPYVTLRALAGNTSPDSVASVEAIKQAILAENIIPTVLGAFAVFGGPVALILGAMAAGSEYGWNTVKVILTQRPGRMGVLSGKVLGLGAVLAIITLVSFIAALGSSIVLAQVTTAAVGLPAPVELVEGMGAAWLILAAWTALGFGLAFLFGATSPAIALGLIYALVLERMIGGFAGTMQLLATVRKGLLGPNADALSASFAPEAFQQANPVVGPAHASLVLAMFILASAGVAALTLARRDVA